MVKRSSTAFFILHTGILADDMGLGKTLQTIALIMTNFTDGKPLAVPVPGKIRQSKILRMQQKAKVSGRRRHPFLSYSFVNKWWKKWNNENLCDQTYYDYKIWKYFEGEWLMLCWLPQSIHKSIFTEIRGLQELSL